MRSLAVPPPPCAQARLGWTEMDFIIRTDYWIVMRADYNGVIRANYPQLNQLKKPPRKLDRPFFL